MTDTAEARESEAAMIDRVFLRPHHSPVNGDMVLALREWYGLDPWFTLTIMGAETSMGDPQLGGELVSYNNFFCMRAFNGYEKSKWGELASGTRRVAGKTWLAFAGPWQGMAAWGRLIKLGPTSKPGYYLERYQARDLRGFAEVYYGKRVKGFEEYVERIKALAVRIKSKAAVAGFQW